MDKVIELNNSLINSDDPNQEIAKGNLSPPNKELKCDICDRTFDSKRKHKNHMKCIHGPNIGCEKCDKSFF